MNSANPDLDPEVVAIIAEACRDQESSLLTLSKSAFARKLTAQERLISPGDAFLGKAERYLLGVYREELAAALHYACGLALSEQRLLTPIHFVDRPSRTKLDRRTRALHSVEAYNDKTVSEGNEALFRGFPSGGMTAVELARRSLLVSPNDASRIALALALDAAGRTQESLDVLCEVLRHRTSSANRAYALGNLGYLHFVAGRHEEARDCYRSAALLQEGATVQRGASWLTNSLLLGDASDAEEAARVLDEFADSAAVDSCLLEIHASRRAGLIKPTKGGRHARETIVHRLPEAAGRIADALW